VTRNISQASDWADDDGAILVFKVKISELRSFNGKIFSSANEQWESFVKNNRSGGALHSDKEVIPRLDYFVMKIDPRSEEYLVGIKNEMVKLFSISEIEAYGRINKFWANKIFYGDNIMLYHEDEEYWAKTIYYGKDSFWWQREDEIIEPIPYP